MLYYTVFIIRHLFEHLDLSVLFENLKKKINQRYYFGITSVCLICLLNLKNVVHCSPLMSRDFQGEVARFKRKSHITTSV